MGFDINPQNILQLAGDVGGLLEGGGLDSTDFSGGMLDLPFLGEDTPGTQLNPQQLAELVAPGGDRMPNPFNAGVLPDTGIATELGRNAALLADVSSPTELGQLFAELFELNEKDTTAMMAALLGNALGAIDEGGIFGNGGLLEDAVADNDKGGGFLGGLFDGGGEGGGLFSGIGNVLGGIFGGGDNGGGLFGFLSDGLGDLIGGDIGDAIGGFVGAATSFATGNYIGGAMAAFDTVSGLINEDGQDQTMNTIGGILDLVEGNFGQALIAA